MGHSSTCLFLLGSTTATVCLDVLASLDCDVNDQFAEVLLWFCSSSLYYSRCCSASACVADHAVMAAPTAGQEASTVLSLLDNTTAVMTVNDASM